MTGAHRLNPILHAKQLQVNYAGNSVLHIADLHISRGEIIGVVGANGAGKSTLANALLGWSRGNPKVKGHINFNNQSISSWPSNQRVQSGLLLVPENKLIFGQMTVEENLSLCFAPQSSNHRKFYSQEEVYTLFPRLKERQHHLGSQLSGGERQMLGIGRALMMGPEVLVLDEPSIGLAPQIVSLVLRTLQVLAKDGMAILLVEQNVRAAIEIVDRLVLLERGRIVLEGKTSLIKDDPRIAQAYLGVQAA